MNFLKKNWIIASCVLIITLCCYLIINGISSLGYPKGSAKTSLLLGIVLLTNLVFSKIKKRFGDKHSRILDRFFVHIAVLILISTSFGFSQKTQSNNAQKEMRHILENRFDGQAVERKTYDQITYGEQAPILQIMNDVQHAQEKKEEECLGGLYKIYDMLKSENLADKQLRDDNKKQLDTLLQGLEKYRTWLHSEMPLIEEKLKKINCSDNVLMRFRESSNAELSINDQVIDAFNDLINSIKEIIEFVEKHTNAMNFVDGTIEWNTKTIKENFAQLVKSMIIYNGKIDELVEKQRQHQKKIMEK